MPFVSRTSWGVTMAGQDDGLREHVPERMQDFIFQRELSEVYLLLDYLSGRSNQSLATALADEKGGKVSIEELCEISWPPQGSKPEQAKQAAKLLLAKDKLNTAAKPASGASIAFTLLVAGDDDLAGNRRGWFRRLFCARRAESEKDRSPAAAPDKPSREASGAGSVAPAAAAASPPAEQPAPTPAGPTDAPSPPPPRGDGGHDGEPPLAGIWGGGAPSRTSLARLPYPGLVGTAGCHSTAINWVIGLLFVWLLLTCLLSWNIAAGRAIVARLDTVEKDRLTIEGKIEKAEVSPAQQQIGVSQAPNPAPAQPATGASGPVQRYCERYLLLPVKKSPDGKTEIRQFESATQRQLCDQLSENRLLYASSCEHVGKWLAPWRSFGIESPQPKKACLPEVGSSINADSVSEHQRAIVLVEILATAVLPIFYGFLGAGAAAVRDIWGKMRDFLLLPRDLTLSLGRIALGAVIGACIGLFISPSGSSAQTGPALTTAVTLTPSALSFIAGFGVEGVFVALESFIKRVFNIPDPK